MKKTLIALAAVAATSAAFAQSSVTLYGIADLGYGSTTTKDAAGVTTAKTSGMVNGIQSGSRWGVKGTEDLGGGLKAGFNFESAIGANDGTGNSDFARRSVLELSGDFGKIGLGRDYVPSFSLIAATDLTGVDATSTADVLFGVRSNNTFMYTSPNFNGLTAKVAVFNQKTAVSDKTSGSDVSVTYTAGALMVGASFNQDKTVASAAVTAKTKGSVIGATYDLGTAKVFFNHIQDKNSLTTAKNKETNLGVSVPMGATTLLAGVGRDNDTSAAGVKTSATDFTLGANYTLSKRTNVYARYYKDAATAGGKSTSFAVGLRHTF